MADSQTLTTDSGTASSSESTAASFTEPACSTCGAPLSVLSAEPGNPYIAHLGCMNRNFQGKQCPMFQQEQAQARTEYIML